ncbi:hypothetical protein AMJ47_02300 [Parcubacteria bacterium DG_72]|nr:MAG: hypothetical protein AMJ47_02300 [Parcubacteria bacterium DG_72]
MKKLIIIIIILIIISSGIFIKFVYKKPSTEPEVQKITVMMPFIPQIQWAAYYTAKNNGYYENEGLNVEIQYSTKGSAGPIEQLVGGNVDFILTDKESIIMARSKDLDIIATYPIEPTNVFYIVSEKDKNITKPSDLIGKKVGLISSASGAYGNLLVILHLSDIDISDIEVVQAGTAVVPAFLEGNFDATAIHLSQKLLIEEKIPDLNIINASEYTDMSSGHIVVNKYLVENNPELIKKFLRATKKGLEYAIENPNEAVEIYIDFNPDAESKREVSQDLWNAFIEEHHYEEKIPGFESPEDWERTQDLLYDVGIITEKKDISEMYTNEFIPQ